MGIINTASLTDISGNNLTNTYANFTYKDLVVRKIFDGTYMIYATACFFKDETAKNEGKKPVFQKIYELNKTKVQLANIYSLLYTQLKIDYPSYTDVM